MRKKSGPPDHKNKTLKPRTVSRRGFLKISALTAAGLGVPLTNGDAAVPSAGAGTEVGFDSEVNSCCQFCQIRCTTRVQVKNRRVVNVYGNRDNVWTEGGMCPKGQSLVELTYSPHRLTYPLRREGNAWKRITYQEALDLVAERILKVKADSAEEYAHQVVLFAPLWESRESELAAT